MPMRAGWVLLFVATLSGQNLMPPPYVRQGGVVNAASHMPVSLPGGALAPGALISIDGLRFKPSEPTVELVVAGRSYRAQVLTSTAEHISARLPLFHETGAAKVFVLSRNQRSSGTDVVLSASAFGIFTTNEKGWGEAAAVSLSHPGANVTLSGTGLGSVKASEIEVLAGGQVASRVRRSVHEGKDQLTFVLPAEVPEGCSVPVAVRTRNAVSNVATIAISRGSECKWFPEWFDRGTEGRKSGLIVLMRSDLTLELTRGKPVHFTVDAVTAGFGQRLKPDLPALLSTVPPPGACVTFAGSITDNDLVLPSFVNQSLGGRDLDLGPTFEEQSAFLKDLDAGLALTVEAPGRNKNAERAIHQPRLYSALLGGDPPFSNIIPTPLFLDPGMYWIQIHGGADIGPAKVSLEAKAPVVWRGRDGLNSIDKRAGMTLEWDPRPDDHVLILVSNIDRRRSLAGFTLCSAPSAASHFTVPSAALANLPATRTDDSELSLGFVGLLAVPRDPPKFSAPGLDVGRAIYASLSGRSAVVK